MIAIIDYGMGNLANVRRACLSFGLEAEIVRSPRGLGRADKIILPGVGAFGQAMRRLEASGLDKLIAVKIKQGVPFLGICLGMHLLFETSQESPGVKGLGIIPGKVVRLDNKQVKVPHMGWNSIQLKTKRRSLALLAGIKEKEYFYFCHSYYAIPGDEKVVSAVCDYGVSFPAVINKKNIVGIQFHPEKSQDAGLAILRNFVLR